MSNPARVESIEALKMFRRAVIKFIEAANVALGDAESEMQRRLNWLENEQDSYWQGQIRKRQEDVSKARDAVRQKKIFKDFAGVHLRRIRRRRPCESHWRGLKMRRGSWPRFVDTPKSFRAKLRSIKERFSDLRRLCRLICPRPQANSMR